MPEFYTGSWVKSTFKPHHCDGCGHEIGVGSEAYRYSVKQDGEFSFGTMHADCRRAELLMNRVVYGPLSEDFDALDIAVSYPEFMTAIEEHYPLVAARLKIHPLTANTN